MCKIRFLVVVEWPWLECPNAEDINMHMIHWLGLPKISVPSSKRVVTFPIDDKPPVFPTSVSFSFSATGRHISTWLFSQPLKAGRPNGYTCLISRSEQKLDETNFAPTSSAVLVKNVTALFSQCKYQLQCQREPNKQSSTHLKGDQHCGF